MWQSMKIGNSCRNGTAASWLLPLGLAHLTDPGEVTLAQASKQQGGMDKLRDRCGLGFRV